MNIVVLVGQEVERLSQRICLYDSKINLPSYFHYNQII